MRPDRVRCRSCQGTHVVLAAGLLPDSGYGLDVIGAALLGAACGHGHRVLATRLTVPAATVRCWPRPHQQRGAATARRTDRRRRPPRAAPTRASPTRLGDALAALAAAALAVVRRFGGDERDLWPAARPDPGDP
ncbi:hypothetical protein [Dactylosporangium sp. CA-233914]|uniref:hypothetical protein n=1 Tax=Dactylosporangium sp. CA-233914 TaxID=3239934 RepID=UPI003D8C83DF